VAPTARDLYDGLAGEYLRRPEVSVGRALQNDVLNVSGKIFAFVSHDRLVVKVPAAQAAELVASGTAEPFGSGGRTMKEWVALGMPARGGRLWRELMADAFAYVSRSGRSAPRGSARPANPPR
jgi:hypothetical protein